MRRHRDRKRNAVTGNDGDVTGDVTVTPPESETEQSQRQNRIDDDGGDEAPAPAKRPMTSKAANDLAEQLLIIGRSRSCFLASD
jgi:hypothetical protein